MSIIYLPWLTANCNIQKSKHSWAHLASFDKVCKGKREQLRKAEYNWIYIYYIGGGKSIDGGCTTGL